MKSLSPGLKAHYALKTQHIAVCWKATLTNGTVVAATTHDEDIVFDGLTYETVSAFNTSTIETGSELNPDNLEVDGFLASPSITDEDIHSGIWDYAAIEMFEVNYKDLTQGRNIIRSGTLGQVRGGRSKFTAELRGLTQKYSRRIVRLVTAECNADLGDSRCKIDLAPWTRTFAVQSVTDDYLLINSAGIEPLNWFTGGKVTFTSGRNAGLSMEVKRSAGSQFELQERMPFPVTVGDTFTVYAGCMKRPFEDCLGKFNNLLNFRGFPHLPGSAVYGMDPATKRGVISPAPGPGGAPAPAPTPSPPATPGPAPAPGPIPPAVDGFPTRVLATYYEAYASTVNTFKITDIPMSFNVIYLFNARFNSDGSVYWPFTDVTAAQVQQCRARGQKVLLTIGGAGVQFVYTNRTHTTNLVSSFISMANSLGGVDGIDWNNFEGSLTSGNYAAFATEASWAVGQLRAQFGTNFGSTSPVGGNTKGDDSDQHWVTAMNAAGALTWVNPQYYDWDVYKLAGFISGYTPAASTDYGTNCNADWVACMGGDASKVVIGFGSNYWGYNLSGGARHDYYELATTLNESIREWDAAVAEFPTQRGVFFWNAYLNSASVNQYGDASSDGNNVCGSTFRAKLDALDYVVPAPAPAPAPAPTPSGSYPTNIITGAHEYEFLQAGNASNAYWIEDNRWGQGSVTSFTQEVGRSLTVGPNGEVAARIKWNWPTGDNEVKGYPAILYGRKPGYYSSSFKPAGKTVILPDGSISTAAPSGWTPGTILPQKHPISSLKAYANTAYVQTPTGKGHVSYDIWLQSAPQQDQGFVSSSITHEIMIPLRHWGGYGSQEQRAPGWYYADAVIGGRTYKVYNPNPSGFASFTYLDGSYGRSGWKFIVFEAATADMPIHEELPLHEFIAYTIAHFPTTGSEYCSSVELGIEPEYGTGDVVIYDYRVYA